MFICEIDVKNLQAKEAGLVRILIMMDQDQPDAIYEINLGRYKGALQCGFNIRKKCNLQASCTVLPQSQFFLKNILNGAARPEWA